MSLCCLQINALLNSALEKVENSNKKKNQSTNINRITDFVLSDSLFARRATDTSQFHAKQRLHILCRLSLGEVDTSDEGAFTNTVHEVRDTAEGYHVENS